MQIYWAGGGRTWGSLMTQIGQMTTHDHISLHQFPYFIYSTRQTREGTMLHLEPACLHSTESAI